MKKYLCFLIGSLLAHCSMAQLNVQEGSTFIIETGSKVTVDGSFSNSSGTVTNKGKLEVKGNFANSGTYGSPSGTDSLLLTGTSDVTLSGGGTSFQYIQLNKSTGALVTLAGNILVNNKLDILSGNLSTNPATAYELVLPVSATLSFAQGTEITGKVRRTGWSNGTIVPFNSPNMTVITNGGTAPTAMLVNMVPNGDPSAAEREVKRTFNFTPAGGTGYTADMSLPYQTNEVNTNTEANLAPWYFQSSEWNAKLTGNTVNTASHFVTTTGIPAATFAATEWKLADPRYTFNVTAFLRGAWTGTTMRTELYANGLLPLAQPYNTTPFNYTGTESVASIPNANVVDWVLLELRKPATGLPADSAKSSTIIGRKAAFLLNNGSIVDLDGATPASFNISKQGTSFIVVRHRNHLAAMSNGIPSNAAGTFANDFSALVGSYKTATAPSDPTVLLSGGTKYGLWAGDANKNGAVNATDVSAVKSAIANSSSGYLLTGVTLRSSINGTDVSLIKSTLASSGTTGAARAANIIDNKKGVVSNVPE